MKTFKLPSNNKKTILALGPESAGNFSLYKNKKVYFSEDFGDLLQDTNFNKFKNELNRFLKTECIKPDIILTDLHPLYKTTILGAELSKKFKAKHIQVQHHLAHIFSAIGDKFLNEKSGLRVTGYGLRDAFGIALDGTGYGSDGKIWGGEIFQISRLATRNSALGVERIGHLENQFLIGGDLAIQEPARMLISALSKFLTKEKIYEHIKKYYSKNEFEVLYNQLQQNFNCQETSGTGRILDAVSILLGFCGNKRNYKHEPVALLEKNSTIPYTDLKPRIKKIMGYGLLVTGYELLTTPLFEYLIKNLHKDKKRLASTIQLYIAQSLHKIAKKAKAKNIYFAGGIANNKIIYSYLESKGVYANKKIPRGDAGLSFGQIFYYLLADSRN